MSSYLDNLTPEQRAILTQPSAHLVRFRQFMAQYRQDKPNAPMNEVQHAYQLACNREMKS